MRDNAILNIVKADLSFEERLTAIDIEDLNDERGLVVVNLEQDSLLTIVRIGTISWRGSLGRSSLSALVSLVAEDVRVPCSIKILGANNCDL